MTQIESVLDNSWKSVNITYADLSSSLLTVPRNPGLYAISTNAPKEILRQIGEREDPKHYNLRKKISASDLLPEKVIVKQHENNLYKVYTGHHGCLRQRMVEHFRGSKGTGCLALFKDELLRNYSWMFDYIDLRSVPDYQDSQLFRTYLEQKYRAKVGWPILCSQ